MRRTIAFLGGLGTSILLGLLVFGLFFIYSVYTPRGATAHSTASFTINRGESVRQIAGRLKDAQIIEHPLFFYLYTLKRGISQQLQAGTYEIPSQASLAEVALMFANGATVPTDLTVTFPEGLTIAQIKDRLREQNLPADNQDLASLLLDQVVAAENPLLAILPAQMPLEGLLFPDTYRLAPDATAQDIAARLVAHFAERVAPYLTNAGEYSFKDILIMASLLEREVKTAKDKKMVAGILWRRLKAGMPLQVDATVLYAMAQAGQGGAINLQIDSAYNTYRQPGLPPGPISNPGLESIIAAREPMASAYWYYLSASDGTTIYSKTFDEHIKAKRRYLQ